MSRRLLILVDDEPVISRTLALDLEDAGYQVDTAADQGEVLRRLRTDPIELVIAAESREVGVDDRMIERMRRVRPGAKVVLMTTDPEADGAHLAGDPVVRVRKPFDLEEFRQVVERLLGDVVETNSSAG